MFASNIFNKIYLSEFIDEKRKKLSEAISSLSTINSSKFNQLIERYVEDFLIKPLEFLSSNPSEPKEFREKVKNYDFGEEYEELFHRIHITLNFSGDRELFGCQPSTSDVVFIREENFQIYSDSSIQFDIILKDLNPDIYNNQVNYILGQILKNIPAVNFGITPWNNNLRDLVVKLLTDRLNQLQEKNSFMEKIGLNINPKSSEFMVPPPIARKIIPIPVSDTSSKYPQKIIPDLKNEIYEDIKEVLYNVGRALERKPSIYKDKQEEDLRDIFLIFLETRYESTSGVGEAFNKKGKTDILLKFAPDGTNIFVAECKVWKGAKEFLKAIDQLLGYLTIRDSKTALMVFVNQKEFTSVIQTIEKEIVHHPQFKKLVKQKYDSSMSYEFSLPDDSYKIIQIEVMLFHFLKNP